MQRKKEYEERLPEPVTHEVIHKLRAAIEKAKRNDIDLHSHMGLGPSGTQPVQVRWYTLERLLDMLNDKT